MKMRSGGRVRFWLRRMGGWDELIGSCLFFLIIYLGGGRWERRLLLRMG